VCEATQQIARNVNSELRGSASAAIVGVPVNAVHIALPLHPTPAVTNTSIRWGLALVAALLSHITLIVLSIICVVVYSYAIHTGESQEFYNAFARASGPWISLIAGGPVFFLVARWIRRRAPSAALGTAMAQTGLYLALDVTVLLLWPADTAGAIPFVIGGFLLKLVGTRIGAGGTLPRQLARPA
jgi:hypothetical protein